ncbi:MAG: M23 family metallopeptidase [Sorangiineae bacterium]|nr:M23 family metallopeptidase [Polyangiaceae bacterium]MEB2322197.1 M23 family metallopeptidase [Sorangiineae bacterium]
MASTPDSEDPRHVGRIVDPSVRDDGEPEPALELASAHPEPLREAPEFSEEIAGTATPPPAATAERGAAEPVHPVRARLLARAAEARVHDEVSPRGDELDEIGARRPARRRPLDLELDLVGKAAGRPPAAPLIHSTRAPLSPSLVAVFSTLLGLAVVATVIALAIHLSHLERPTSGARAPAPSATAPVAEAEPVPTRPARPKIPGPWRISDEAANPTYRVLKGEIGHDPFLKVVQAAGLDKTEAYRVLTAFKGLRDFDKCARTDSFQALVERSSKKLTAFEYIVSKEEVYQARAGADGLLKASKLDFKVERAQVKGALVFDGDFERSAKRAGFDEGLAQTVASAIAGHMALDDMKRGDVLKLIAQEVTVLGEFARYAGLEAFEYQPAGGSGKPLRLYFYRDAGTHGAYYDGSGKAPYEGGWRFPLPGARISSPFNLTRMHPILKKVTPHLGTDIAAPSGTPIHASSFGTVDRMSGTGATGLLVVLEHPGGYETGYAHMSRFAEGLKVGDHVKRMDVVGYVGNTGRSTGPHLHWFAKKDDKYIDPMSLNPDGLRVLPPSERDAFAKVREGYDALLDGIVAPPPLPAEAAASAAPPAEPVEDDEPNFDEASPGATATAAATAALVVPAEAKPTSTAPTPAAPATGGNPVFLTDKDLLKQQPPTDDGEVSE